MGAMTSQITSLTSIYSTVHLGVDKRKHQSPASLARGIHRQPVNSPHKWPGTRNMLPFDDVVMRTSKGKLIKKKTTDDETRNKQRTTDMWVYHIGCTVSVTSMTLCKTTVTPLLTRWSYCSLALSHRSIATHLNGVIYLTELLPKLVAVGFVAAKPDISHLTNTSAEWISLCDVLIKHNWHNNVFVLCGLYN